MIYLYKTFYNAGPEGFSQLQDQGAVLLHARYPGFSEGEFNSLDSSFRCLQISSVTRPNPAIPNSTTSTSRRPLHRLRAPRSAMRGKLVASAAFAGLSAAAGPAGDVVQRPLGPASDASDAPRPIAASPRCDYGCDEIPVANAALESYIQGLIKRWHVPGLAIAIVDGNKTWSKVRFCLDLAELCVSHTFSPSSASPSIFID